MVVVVKRDEAEGLKDTTRRLAYGSEYLGHPSHGARLRLKREFDEGAISERARKLQQSAGRGNGLEFSFGAPAIF